MAGVLSPPCHPIFFPMKCDVYYSVDTQNDFGTMVHDWQFDGTRFCSFYVRGDETNNGNLGYGEKKFYNMETVLFGRTQTDVRKSGDGLFYPLTHVLITNIRSGDCNNEELYFYETNNTYDPVPIVFEIIMNQPVVSPFGDIEYFKMELQRSDIQEIQQ
jgi:hypothetical protein